MSEVNPPRVPSGFARVRLAVVLGAIVLAVTPSGCAGDPAGTRRFAFLESSEDATPLLRTDGTREDRWPALLARVAIPSAEGFLANVAPITDERVMGLTDDQIRRLPRDAKGPSFLLVADAVALANDEFPILVVDLSGEDRASFRVSAKCLWAVQNNLSIANVDWEDFAESVDPDGVYRSC